jgi:hypothetical protein
MMKVKLDPIQTLKPNAFCGSPLHGNDPLIKIERSD